MTLTLTLTLAAAILAAFTCGVLLGRALPIKRGQPRSPADVPVTPPSGPAKTPPLVRYRRLVARLFQLRGLGQVSDDAEEMIAESLDNCRRDMTPEEEIQIPELIAKLRATVAPHDLGLRDTRPDARGHTREKVVV